MTPQILIATLILAPLVGFLLNGFRYQKNSANLAGVIATIAVAQKSQIN